jgi:trigger factor
MQVTETLSDGLKRAFTVVVPAGEIESRRTARLVDLGKSLRLPGFRPGKVPMTIVRQRYGIAVTAEVVEAEVNEATQKVMTDRGLRPAMQPKVEVISLDEAGSGAKDLEFKVEMELLPEIAMPDFSAIHLTRRKAEVQSETVDKALGALATRNRELIDLTPEELETRTAAIGDVLTVDFLGRIDGEAFQGGTGTDMDVEIGGAGFIPGFSDGMVGMKPGETRTIDVTFPEEYGAKELAGKAASFEITAKKLRSSKLPEIDDDLGKKLGFEGLEPVRTAITEQMQREYDQLARMRLKRELLDALAATASFPAPEGMVEAEFAQIWQRIEADRTAGKLDEEDKSKDEAVLRSEYRAIAERRVRLGLLLAEIGRVNSLTVGADEMTRAMRMEASRYPGQEQQVMEFFRTNPQAGESLRGPLFEDKVVDYVLELASVNDVIVTPEELAAEPPANPASSPAAEPAQTGAAEIQPG